MLSVSENCFIFPCVVHDFFHGGLLFNVDILVVGVMTWLTQCKKKRLGYDSLHILHKV